MEAIMAEMKEFTQDGVVLARYIPAEVAWKGGLQFFSPNDDFIQVGTWGYDNGKQLLAHAHNHVDRNVAWTQEVLYVRKGKLLAKIFGTDLKPFAEQVVHEGDVIVLLRGGHGYEILEDGSQILEIKNGPYLGPEVDRRRF
jgi:hypothetical protein